MIAFLLLTACQKTPMPSTHIQMPTDIVYEYKVNVALKKHNQLRTLHFDDAPLHYSKKVEQAAQDYANKLAKSGNFDHDSDNLKNKYGENLFAFSLNRKPDLNDIIQKWYDEKQYYTYETQECVDGHMCGHYTQIVWKESKFLGCASAQYKKGRFKGGYVTVCKYYPYGNIIGQDPF